MADISKIQLQDGTYDIKDEISRNAINKIAYNNIFVGTFFDITYNRVHFLTSLDGINWNEFNKSVNIIGRDPQLTYNEDNKTFYLCVTAGSGEVNCKIYTSTDFTTWTEHEIKLGLSNICWAPELFFDDNKIYLLISNGTENAMQQVLFECASLENLTFENGRTLNLGLTDVIDGSLTKYNSTYYLIVKDDTTDRQKIYTSNDLTSWIIVNSNVLNSSEICEGGQLLNINGRWHFYGDTYMYAYQYGIMQTDDITNFGKIIHSTSLTNYRHGSVLLLKNDANKIVTNVSDYNNAVVIRKQDHGTILTGTIDKLIVYPDYIYRVQGDVVINTIENPYNLQLLPIIFTTSVGATLTIPIGSSTQATVITNTYATNEKLMLVSLQADWYYLSGGCIKENISASDLYEVNSNDWTVTLYKAVRMNNMVHIELNLRKTSSTSTEAITFKAPFKPVSATQINNDKGTNMFVRSNGTVQGTALLNVSEDVYCYLSYEIE